MPVLQTTATSPGDTPAKAPPAITVADLHRVYEAEDGITYALQDINLEIAAGEFVSVVGQSGCGKSTLLNIIAGLDRADHGSVTLHGEPVTRPRPQDVGYVFQQPVLLPWRRIIDNIMLPTRLMRKPVSGYRERAHELLELVGLAGFERRFPHQLSGGMQQRAAIVRALLHAPRVLLMDEPFGALDALTRDRMNVELLRIWQTTGTTVVFVTHDLREAAFLSDRVVVMSARPGSVREIVASTLPRPRDREVLFSEELRVLTSQLGDCIV
jgi:NitT/TauT family transport system ATP-binding protein